MGTFTKTKIVDVDGVGDFTTIREATDYFITNNIGMTFNILFKEEDTCIAHCLELDIVATSRTIECVEADIMSLITAQIEYAFENNNLENLYHPAPPEVWKEYFSCTTAL